jgi:PAS domain S-box-containing protein
MAKAKSALKPGKLRAKSSSVRRSSQDDEETPGAAQLEVQPLKGRNAKKQDLLVMFQKVDPARPDKARTETGSAGKKHRTETIERIERELAATREHLRALIAEHESAQEEMQAANEEILSGNEELQSTNEELETAKEELQSSNEELVTLNDELQHRNDELSVLTHDLNNLLVGIDIPVLVLDAELQVRRFTPEAGKLLDLIPGDVGRRFSNIAPPLDVADWSELLAEVTGHGRLIEREVRSRDGKRYSLRVRPYKTNDNKIEGVLIVMLDTESISHARDMAEEAANLARAELGKSESTVRALLKATTLSIVGVNAKRNIVVVNGSIEKMFGYRPEELIGQPLEILVPENAGERHAAYQRMYFANMQSRPMGTGIDLRGRRKDGSLFPVEIDLNVIETPEGKLGVAFVSDITQRKEMERAAQAHAAEVRESEERFRNMADSAPVMIWVSGPDKLCTFFNQGWLKFTGRTLAQELGNGWAEGVHSEHLDRSWDTYASSFDARRAFQMEYRLRRADGQYRWVLDSGVPRFDPRGGLLGYIGSCVDIEDLKLAHEEILVKQKMETVGTLAGGIAHDFNNLLGGVLAHTELALAELASGSNPAEELESIHDAALRGAEIVRQLMIYAGEDVEVVELVDVSGIVHSMLELLKVSVSKHVRLESDLSKHTRSVRANTAQIRQIVMNLFYNASEAIGNRDGVIRVTTRQVTAGSDSSLANSEHTAAGDYVQLDVSDTGRGMTPEVQAKAFDPLFTTKPTGSHGHGLAVVKRIVELHHGTIRVSTEPGKGTTFQIALPCEQHMVEPTHSLTGAKDNTLALMRATIVVVEDEHLLRQGISKMLQRNGLSVVEASDGTAALDVVRTQKDNIDVLLLDITLPGASSREVYEEAKRLRPDLPVIVTSAKSKEIAAASLATNVERFLRKPFSLTDLIEMIRQILSGSQGHSEQNGKPN